MSYVSSIHADIETVNGLLSSKSYLPKKQLVSESIKTSRPSSWVEWTTYAVDRPYISMNDPEVERCRWIMVDCDHADYDSFPGSFPRPRCTVITRKSGRHHHIFELATPVLTGADARFKPKKMLATAERTLCWHLGGDESYSNRLTKNPWNGDAWSTIWWPNSRPLELSEILEWSETEPANVNRRHCRPDPRLGIGRNVAVFDHTRHWAYDHWSGDRQAVHDVAHAFNASLPDPLPHKEVGHTVSSICRFMENRYTGSCEPRYTKRADTQAQQIAEIKMAEEAIRSTGQRPTIPAISAVSGFSDSTVKRLLRKIAEAE